VIIVIRKTLAELRNEKKLTQRDLAGLIGLKPSTIAMYETGERTPLLNTAKKIASYFGLPVEAICFGIDARNMRTGKDQPPPRVTAAG